MMCNVECVINYELRITNYIKLELDWKNKRIVILGLARQGTALSQYLVNKGARVAVSDARPTDELKDSLAA
ncbi:MAG TPA: hypothetical protein VJ020_03665, partial [Anaerolineales bacterium]|nr:hypothetical protein [Anaerolineales bacterium]